eukprot:TRINITY_DN2270_c1_g1_i1.p1 TRINITY_DN2270_c1_g1~~TRINITY_DN2270_c1_g1_i1.p1  ORF type:complete len:527 (-),score=155.27 TRINITY_DN2270_c1_g1_i1:38-1618(-)
MLVRWRRAPTFITRHCRFLLSTTSVSNNNLNHTTAASAALSSFSYDDNRLQRMYDEHDDDEDDDDDEEEEEKDVKSSMKKRNYSWKKLKSYLLHDVYRMLQGSHAKVPSEVQIIGTKSIMMNHPTIINSPTGTGKTLAYLIPCFQDAVIRRQYALKAAQHEEQGGEALEFSHYTRFPSALVIVPTKDLVNQVHEMASPFCQTLGIKVLKVDPSKVHNTIAPGIWISTPHLLVSNEYFVFDKIMPKLRYIVIDEADFIFDSKVDLCLKLIRRIQQIRKQNLGPLLPVFVGATMPSRGKGTSTQVIARHMSKFGLEVVRTFGVHAAGAHITQEFIPVEDHDKRLLDNIAQAVKSSRTNKIMVFANLVDSVDEIASGLKRRLRDTVVLKCSKEQNTLSQFKDSPKKTVLVATDMAARGMDFPDIGLVIQAEFALNAIAYLHRIGRTGRFGKPGHVLNFYRSDSVLQQKIKEHVESGLPLEDLFSRRRLFTKKIKKERRQVAAGQNEGDEGDEGDVYEFLNTLESNQAVL